MNQSYWISQDSVGICVWFKNFKWKKTTSHKSFFIFISDPQLGPSRGVNKKEVGDREGRRLDDAVFFFCLQKNNGPERSDLVSF